MRIDGIPGDGDITRAKEAIRADMRSLRRRFVGSGREKQTADIISALRSLCCYRRACTVAAYSASWGEVDVSAVCREKRVLLPRCTGDGIMEFADIAGMRPGRYGNPEPWGGEAVPPEDIDVILVPALAFTRRGDRLGMGAGYYDAYLPRLKSSAVIIGIGFSFQLLDWLPCREQDVNMDIVICGGEVFQAD